MVKQYEIYWVVLDPTLGSEINKIFQVHTAMTQRAHLAAKETVIVGIVHVHTIFIEEVEFQDAERIFIPDHLSQSPWKKCFAISFPLYRRWINNAIVHIKHLEILFAQVRSIAFENREQLLGCNAVWNVPIRIDQEISDGTF